MADDLTAVDELYALDSADFVVARNALAKRLKAAGDRRRRPGSRRCAGRPRSRRP